MPMLLPVVAAGFLAAGAVLSTTAIAFTVAGIAVTWAAAATIAGVVLMAASVLTMKKPKIGQGGSQLQTKTDAKQPIPVLYGRTATGGNLIFQDTSGSKNKYLYAALALSVAGPIVGIEAVYAGDVRLGFMSSPYDGPTYIGYTVPASKKVYQKNSFWWRFLHGDRNAEPLGTCLDGLGPLPGNPGAMSGIAAVVYRAEYDTDAFPQGVPKLMVVTLGVKAYDPRKDGTYPGGSGGHRFDDANTWEFTENPHIAALHWCLGKWENGKKVVGIGADISEIDVQSFITGANISDANGWKIGGVVTATDDKFEVLKALLQAGGAVPIARGAFISCLTNAPVASTFTITREDVVGPIEIGNTTGARDRHNQVIPSYREESQNWQVIQGELVGSNTYLNEDNGQQRTLEVEYGFVQQAAQAHQLGAYDLVNGREFLSFTMGLRQRCLELRVGDACVVNIEEIAAQNQKCVVVQREFNPADWSITLTLRSETDAKHAFALGQSQIAPPSPQLHGFNASDPDAPSSAAWSVVGGTISANGQTVPVLVINGENDNPYTRSIIVKYRPVGSADWLDAGTYPANTTKIEITGVTSGTAYEVEIIYETVVGAISDPLILAPVLAGTASLDFSIIDGATKPQDNATVGAPLGTYVGNVPVEDLIAAVNGGGGIDVTPPGKPLDFAFTSPATSLDVMGSPVTKIVASWHSPGDSDLDHYILSVREGSGSEIGYYVSAPTDASALVSWEYNVRPNTTFTAHVYAVDKVGNRGVYTDAMTVTSTKDTTPPAPPTNFNITPVIKNFVIGWTNPADTDLSSIELHIGSTDVRANATLAGSFNAIPGKPGNATIDASTFGISPRWFWIVARDTSDNYSTEVGPFQSSALNIATSDLADDIITQAQLADNSVTTDAVNAGAIVASKIAVTGASLFPDGQMQDTAWWTSNPSGLLAGGQTQVNGHPCFYIDTNPDAAVVTAKGSRNAWVTTPELQGSTMANIQLYAPMIGGIIPGETYEAKSTVYNASNRPFVSFVLQWFKGDGTHIDADVNVAQSNNGVSTKLASQGTAPAGAVYYRLYWDANGSADAFTGQIYIGGITLRQANGGTMVVDGSLTANKILMDQGFADKFFANTLTVSDTFAAKTIESVDSLPASLTIGNTGFQLGTIQAGLAGGTSGGNRVRYSDFEGGKDVGWGVYNSNGQPTSDQAIGDSAGNKYFNNSWSLVPAGAYTVVQSEIFDVTPGERISYQAALGGYDQFLGNQRIGLVYLRSEAGGDYSQVRTEDFIRITGQAGYPHIVGDFVTVPSDAKRCYIQLVFEATGTGSVGLTLSHPMVASAAAGQTILPSYEPSGNTPNAAAVVNANTTKINPGQILISADTTLNDWKNGPDSTEIKGGKIAANSIMANSINVGLRGIEVLGITFDTDRNNTVGWSAGYIDWIDESGNRQVATIASGSYYRGTANSQVAYVWFDKVASQRDGVLFYGETTPAYVLSNPNNIILASYFGGTVLNSQYGRTIIDGDIIKTGTVYGDRIIAGTLAADRIQAGTIDANQIRVGGVDISRLTRTDLFAPGSDYDQNYVENPFGLGYTQNHPYFAIDLGNCNCAVQSVVELVVTSTVGQLPTGGNPVYDSGCSIVAYIPGGGEVRVPIISSTERFIRMIIPGGRPTGTISLRATLQNGSSHYFLGAGTPADPAYEYQSTRAVIYGLNVDAIWRAF